MAVNRFRFQEASGGHLKDHFQFDWHPERKALHAEHQARRYFVLSEDIAEEFRGSIGNGRLVEEIPGCRYIDSESHNLPRAYRPGQGTLKR